MQNAIRIDVYTPNTYRTGSTHVFVCGYALNSSECTTSIAHELAKKFDQKEITVTTYSDGLPSKSTIIV